MSILTIHPTSPQQFKVILSSFNSIRELAIDCLCLHVKVYVFCGEEFNYLQNPFKRNVFTTYSQFLLISIFSKILQAANATIQNHLDQTELKRCQFLNVPQ